MKNVHLILYLVLCAKQICVRKLIQKLAHVVVTQVALTFLTLMYLVDLRESHHLVLQLDANLDIQSVLQGLHLT